MSDADGLPMNRRVLPLIVGLLVLSLGCGGDDPVTPFATLQVATTSSPNGAPTVAYSQTLAAAGGDGSYTWSVTVGSLPTGLSLNTPTGLISGTPTGSSSTFTVQVVSGDGQMATQQLTITVNATLTVTTTSLPDGVENVDYGTQALVATGGGGSDTWALASGSGPLPTGLGLAVNGDITGTPTVVGTQNFTVEVASGDGQTAQQALSITVTLRQLQDAVPLAGLAGSQDEAAYYVFTVPATSPQLEVVISGGTGDADLYVREGAPPTTSEYDCRPFLSADDETCGFVDPASGDWFIMVYGSTAYTGVTLTATTACTLNTPGDADGDRLPDCVETDSGVFVTALNTGTDPNNPDTDGDGISDGDEVLGSVLGLDLPLMGVSPLRTDILVEYDWFSDVLDCGTHSHRPTAAIVARVTASFASSPVANPDGSTGINFIHDYGQGGVFTGGNLIGDADGVLVGGVNSGEFLSHKAANFDPNRGGYFHYVMLPHRYNTSSSSSGQAELFGDDVIVSLQCSAQVTVSVANTIVHELGHNFGLRHGGFESINYKPNYNSVMNYKYQFPGIDNDCTPPGNGVLSYSTGVRPPLDETNLDETQGICGNPPGPGWDWNGDLDATDVGLVYDINIDSSDMGDGAFGILQDYNDWAALFFDGLGDADGAPLAIEIVSCMNAPL